MRANLIPPSRQKVYYGWIIAVAALIIATTLLGIRVSFGVFFKSLEAEFALSRAATSSVFSVYMVVYAVQAALSGWALDRYGPRLVVSLMGLFTGLSLLITSQITSLWQIFLTYSLILAIGTGGSMPVVTALVSRWFNKKRGLALGIVSSGSGMGTLVMAPFAAFLIVNLGWRMSYVVLGLVAWLVVISAAMFLRRDPSQIGVLPDGAKMVAAPDFKVSETDSQLSGFSLSQAFRTRSFWQLASVWFLFAFTLNMIVTHLVAHAMDKGISAIEASTVMGLAGGLSILAKLIAGPVSDRVGRKIPGIASSLVGAAALVWLVWAHNLWMLYVFAVLFGFAWGGVGVNIITMASDIFGKRRIGTIMGTLEIGFSLGAAAGPALGGLMFDITGSYTLAFVAAVVAMLSVSLLLLFTRREANG
ncbi:MAG: MFS transporter [Chloroflexota bacterium]|nr:MFS transporter [Chloroflexota bacterium]